MQYKSLGLSGAASTLINISPLAGLGTGILAT